MRYRCAIREERLRARLSKRFEAIYNPSLLEEIMRLRFQKVLEIKSPRDLFTSVGAFVLSIHSLEAVIPWQKNEPQEN